MLLMDSTFLLTLVAVAIGIFTLFGTSFFMVYIKLRFLQVKKDLDSSSSSYPPSPSSSLCSSSPPSSLSFTSSSSSLSSRSSLCSSSSSSPPFSSSCKWTHDVFPSFRGEDVRKNFFSHFKKEFRRKGITPFIDNGIKRGESIGPELIQAIRKSKIAVVLFSKNYANSKWCLNELVEIMKCKKELNQTVFPIFYGVSPSDVKKLTGEFGETFAKTCVGKTKEDTERWRQAFAEMATIAGYDSSSWDDEAVMIEEIVNEISKRLISSTPSRYIEGLIGMEAHMKKMKSLICLGSDEVRMVGIWGPSGIGKTTIARVLYDQISGGFQHNVFMTFKPSYARPVCSDDYDEKLHLEQQFLSQLMNQEDIKIPYYGAAQNFLMHKKVLVIFDGVEQLVQLLSMPEARYFGPGTRIIITTQNLRLLNAFEIEHIYQVDLPPHGEALQIFCMNAFGQNFPKDGFKKLVEKVTVLSGRLPLGLKVMGSHFRGLLSKQEWKAELPRLRFRLDGEIGSILKFSYDALHEEDKELFLHIACFFNDEGIDHTFEDALIHIFPQVSQGRRVLVQRSLISDEQIFPMHNLLVQLGREIVRNQSIYEPGKRPYLVDAKEICEVLTHDTDSGNVIGINFGIEKMEDDLYISDRAFENVPNLQFLRCHPCWSLKKLHLPQGLTYLPPRLRILHWNNFPMECLPPMFNPRFLVKINMQCSSLEKLWDGIQPLQNLKLMNLNSSIKLKELPDLSTAINLLKMHLMYCKSLGELPSSIGNATNLQELNLFGCTSLVELPPSIGNIKGLQKLDIALCSSLMELPSSIENFTNLQELDLEECSSLVKIPSSVGNVKCLRKLRISSYSHAMEASSSILDIMHLTRSYRRQCFRPMKSPIYLSNFIFCKEKDHGGFSRLWDLPHSVGNATDDLQDLNLGKGSSLVEIPSSIGNLTNLQELNITCLSSLVEIPSSIGNLINLHKLHITYCTRLLELPSSIENLTNLQELNVSRCSSLMELPSSIGNLTSLKDMCTIESSSLVELPCSIGNLANLEILYLYGCFRLMELPSSLENLKNLQKLDLRYCSSLVELPSFIGNITNLEHLKLSGCSSLKKLPDSIGNLTNSRHLDLSHCSSLVELPSSIGYIVNLEILKLNRCSSLVEIPSSIGNLQRLILLNLERCSKLEVLPTNINLASLEELDASGCSQLRNFPEISTNIKELRLHGTLIKEVPSSIKLWSKLEDFSITYCKNLEEFPHVFDIITHLELNDKEIEEIPQCIDRMPGLRRLVLNKCTKLVSLPQLPGSLLSLVAENCESLERLACSFPKPNYCLKFINCWKLNEEARDIIIQTWTLGYSILPGREMHAFFTNQAITGGSLTVNLKEKHFPTSLRFRVCIFLANKVDRGSGAEEVLADLSATITTRKNGRNSVSLMLRGGCKRCLHPLSTKHMYTFEMEAGNVDSSELLFKFKLNNSKEWEIAACGIRELVGKSIGYSYIM